MADSKRPHVREGREKIGGKQRYQGMSKEHLYRPEVEERTEWKPPKTKRKQIKFVCLFCHTTEIGGDGVCPDCGGDMDLAEG
jgi:rubrerythrin